MTGPPRHREQIPPRICAAAPLVEVAAPFSTREAPKVQSPVPPRLTSFGSFRTGLPGGLPAYELPPAPLAVRSALGCPEWRHVRSPPDTNDVNVTIN
jgi:hypothetical protein